MSNNRFEVPDRDRNGLDSVTESLSERVVVFGHTGFVGRELYHKLKKSGRMVSGFSTAQCDLLDFEAVRSCLESMPRPFDLVNCAVITRSFCKNYDGFQKNVLMFQNIIDAIPAGACRSFTHMSSVDVYGYGPDLPVHEDSPLRPATYYAMAKLDCEWLLGLLRHKDFPVAVLRLPGIYGPGDRGLSVIGKLLRKTVKQESLEITNGGNILRDYLLVDDLLEIVMRLLEEPRQMVVNVMTGQSDTLRDILEIIFDKTGMRSEIRFTDEPGTGAADLIFDISRCREYFPGFEFTPVSEGIGKYADEYKSNGEKS